jgi:choline transport protein
VDRHTTIPSVAVLVVFLWAAVLGLINIGNTTAFNAVVSLVLEGFYTSYLLACGMLLYRRCSGGMREPDGRGNMTGSYEWGPWRVRGLMGIVNNCIACGYLILLTFFSYWPTALPVTAANMNYSSLCLGVVAIFSMVYYVLWARKTYNGPIVEVQMDKI